jgi:hypothetical protein
MLVDTSVEKKINGIEPKTFGCWHLIGTELSMKLFRFNEICVTV